MPDSLDPEKTRNSRFIEIIIAAAYGYVEMTDQRDVWAGIGPSSRCCSGRPRARSAAVVVALIAVAAVAQFRAQFVFAKRRFEVRLRVDVTVGVLGLSSSSHECVGNVEWWRFFFRDVSNTPNDSLFLKPGTRVRWYTALKLNRRYL